MEKDNKTKFFQADEALLKNLNVGHPLIINIEDEYTDFALFLSFNEETQDIVCIDSFNQNIKKYNIASYDNCYIVNIDWLADNYIEMLEE